MKQLIGIAHNIEKVIIGKITTKNEMFSNKNDLIFVTRNNKIPNGFVAVITSNNSVDEKSKCFVENVENISELYDNDIVTIYPDGRINVVFEIKSKHNAVFVTERCNSNCIMCPQPPIKKEENEDNFELNLKYISLIDKNTVSIGITGGEPTLLGTKLFEILSAIYKRIPNATIHLLSNGIKFENYEYASKFAQSINQDIVIDVPLYSDIDTIHNSIVRTNTFYKTIKGIYNLAKFNIKIGIRVVVHKMNYDRLPELSEYIYSNFPFVFHVAFMQMEPMGFAKDNIKDLWIDPVDYNNELEKALLNLYYRDLHISVYNTQLCVLPEKLRHFAVQSISDWKNIYIDECKDCCLVSKCPGFFASSKDIHSRKIKAINDLQAKIA
ncbi:MAG TPA: His-Xaa-Ser system radical SAM maturase HxsC [Bacteroidales bacterium]|nr:MAG: His-Xaa-Ser system radical SAM maturase HxsC [Bacteroidetes bacterium GWF2_35_48]OFZ00071.1 MAG: His-Xaa-Ser system radical SAM maturase HxsC [Bacteroidetes bacterium RIFOXYC12_FULL_35_7]HBX51114.1 His-Xaa-Ser system radical SAM maturase HxsC [Bacteroidales bacterium]